MIPPLWNGRHIVLLGRGSYGWFTPMVIKTAVETSLDELDGLIHSECSLAGAEVVIAPASICQSSLVQT